MDNSTSQYLELLNLLLEMKGEEIPEWKVSLFRSGYELEIVGGGSILLTDFKNEERSTTGYALSVYGVEGISNDPLLVESDDSRGLFVPMEKLYKKAKKEASSNNTDISAVLDRFRSPVR